jgi:pyruvate kinase
MQPKIDNSSLGVNSQAFPGFSREAIRALERPVRASKIVATLGPASDSPEMIAGLIEDGVNVMRFNFSHGTHEKHLETLGIVRETSQRLSTPVAVLQDLQGPKTRLSDIPWKNFTIEDSATVSIRYGKYDRQKPEEKTLYTEAFDPVNELSVNQRIYLSDAEIELRVLSEAEIKLQGKERREDEILAEVVHGGSVRSRTGIAIPDSSFSPPPTSEKDIRDLHWGLKNDVDYVGLSFVSCAQDIRDLREEMRKADRIVPIIAKIEREEALDNLEEIVREADGLMVARGDLGIAIPEEDILIVQEQIIRLAHKYGKPVIVATQMLHSMIESNRATRSEVTDVMNSVRFGADANMLSGEVAIGVNPRACVQLMSRLNRRGEALFDHEAHKQRLRSYEPEGPDSLHEVTAMMACAAAHTEAVEAIIVISNSGKTCDLVSKHRPEAPIYLASPNPETVQRSALRWGVSPLPLDLKDTSEPEQQKVLQYVASEYFAKNPTAESFGAVIVSGPTPGDPSSRSRFDLVEVPKP